MQKEMIARTTAGLIALAAFLAMFPPLLGSVANGATWGEAIWNLLRFFTITTNSIVAIAFAWVAFRGVSAVPPLVMGGVVLAILLVGVIFNLLLEAHPFRTIWDAIGDRIHHVVTPIALPIWWLLFFRHGSLRWSAPLFWIAYPIAYSVYIVVRVSLEAPGGAIRYPYFFMDVEKLGWPTALANMAGIAVGFALAGLAVVALDQRLAKSSANS